MVSLDAFCIQKFKSKVTEDCLLFKSLLIEVGEFDFFLKREKDK